MRDSQELLRDMLNTNIQPLKNVISQHRKPSSSTDSSPTLAGKPQHVVDEISSRVDLMRDRYEMKLDLWTGEPLPEEI